MRRSVCAVLMAVIALGPIRSAAAWHQAGHQIVAAIAFQQLTPEERKALVELLRHHPRYEQDFDEPMADEVESTRPVDTHNWLLQRAAIWPDMARSFRGEDKKKYHHPEWHYINVPCYLTPEAKDALEGTITVNLSLDAPDAPQPQMNVIQTIRFSQRVLKDSSASKEDKAIMLAWLIHTVGDIHQPLHSSALYSQMLFPHGDRGGNAIPTEHKGNLHSLWDDLPGGRIKFNTVRLRAAAILADNTFRSLGEHAAGQLDEEVWMNESHAYAISTAYDDAEVLTPLREAEDSGDTSELAPLELSEAYIKTAGKLASQRLAEAGFRLGMVLKDVAQENQ